MPLDEAPPGVTVVPPGGGVGACTAEYLCFLDDRDEPAPTWLAEVVDALADGATAVRWGELWLRPDGMVGDVHLPPPSRPGWHHGIRGLALRRSELTGSRRLRWGTRVHGVPRILATRHASRTLPRSLSGPRSEVIHRLGTHHHRRTSPQVSVILPIHRADEELAEQLAALALQDYQGQWELIIVDNGAVDTPVSIPPAVRDQLPEMRIVRAPAKRSAGYARNVGWQVARGDLLLFCDADDVADLSWVTAMVSAAHEADLVGGALDCALLSPDLLDEQPAPMPDQPEFLPFARSANCGAWRDVLLAVGGWSERFVGGGGEDVDLSWRAQLAGYRLAYAPAALMHYRLRPTLGGLARQKWRYGLTGAPLYRTYRHAGYTRRATRQVLWSWLWLIRHTPDLAHGDDRRRRWVRYAARLAGFSVGSLRHRVAFL